MAQRRMFARSVTESDAFLDLSASARALYFALGMAADDDGFLAAPQRVARENRAAESDLAALAEAGLVIWFKSGTVCVTDWHVNNQIRRDRYNPTRCKERSFVVLEDGRYKLADNKQKMPTCLVGCQNGNQMAAKRQTYNTIYTKGIDNKIDRQIDRACACEEELSTSYPQINLDDLAVSDLSEYLQERVPSLTEIEAAYLAELCYGIPFDTVAPNRDTLAPNQGDYYDYVKRLCVEMQRHKVRKPYNYLFKSIAEDCKP